MKKTRIGNLVRVKNEDKKKSANTEYEAVLLKKDGTTLCYLFTDVELSVAASRSRKNTEDHIEQSFVSKLID